MNRRLWVAFLASLLFLSLASCGQQDNSGTLTTSNPGGSVTSAVTPSEPGESTTWVRDPSGDFSNVPVVDDDRNFLVTATSVDPRVPDVTDTRGDYLMSWCDLIQREQGHDWYVAGVDARKEVTGFNWADVETYCQRQRDFNIEARAINAFGRDVNLSDAELRAKAEPFVGKEKAQVIPIIRHTASLMNTRKSTHSKMADFLDRRSMTRVSVHPIYLRDGKWVMSAYAGVFVNCHNVWHEAEEVPEGPPTSVPPTGNTPSNPVETTQPRQTTTVPRGSTTTQPQGSTTTTRPEVTTTTTPHHEEYCPEGQVGRPPDDCKDTPAADPASQHNTPPGGSGPETGGSDEGETDQPATPAPDTYTPPPAPTVPPPPVTAPQAPPTTAPPPDDPEVNNPPVVGDPGPGEF